MLEEQKDPREAGTSHLSDTIRGALLILEAECPEILDSKVSSAMGYGEDEGFNSAI